MSNAGEASKITPLWKARLTRSEAGTIKPNLTNALSALNFSPEWQGCIGHDEFCDRIVVTGKLPWANHTVGESWSDNHDTLTAVWLQDEGVNIKPHDVVRAVEAVAKANKFHPIRRFLGSMSWDGIHRLDSWLENYMGAIAKDDAQQNYLRDVGIKWLVSAVARIYQPGCKVDQTLILEGKQGTKKSSALNVIFGPWFTDQIADIKSKDAAIELRGKWCVEVAELDRFRGATAETAKAFFSRQSDHYVPKYARHAIDQKRQCVFVGTTNQDAYFTDETGNRRYWPVITGEIRIDELNAVRNQLWAEAKALYDDGQAWWPDATLTTIAAGEQAERYEHDIWAERIGAMIEQRRNITINEIMEDLGIPVKDRNKAAEMRISRELKSLGWFKTRAGTGARARFYTRDGSNLPDLI